MGQENTIMNNPLLYFFFKKRARELEKSIPSDYREILLNHSKLTSEYIVCFSVFKDNFRKTLNATSVIPGMIVFSYEWAAQLIWGDNGVSDVFKETLGHEITHKKKWFKVWNLHGSQKRFACWTNEVYADFRSSLEVDGVDKNTILKAMNYKLNAKTADKTEGLEGKEKEDKIKEIDKNTSTHPSWGRRIKYVTKYNFNQKLVKKIAKDAHYQHSDKDDFIAKVADFFPEIILDESLENRT